MSSATLPGPTPINWTDAEFDRMVALGVLPANHSRRGVRFTRTQFRDLWEHGFFREGQRAILIDGQVIEMPKMNEPHASGISLVAAVMRAVIPTGHYVREQQPLDVNTNNDPLPDVTVVPGNARTYRNSPTAPDVSLALVLQP